MRSIKELQLADGEALAAASMTYGWEKIRTEDKARLVKMLQDNIPANIIREYTNHLLSSLILPALDSTAVRARVLQAVRFITDNTETAELERAYLQTLLITSPQFRALEKKRDEELQKRIAAAATNEKRAEEAKAAVDAKKMEEAKAKKAEEDRAALAKAAAAAAAAAADVNMAPAPAAQAAANGNHAAENKVEEARRVAEQLAARKLKQEMDAALIAKMADETVAPLATYAPIFQEIIENAQCLKEFEEKSKMESDKNASFAARSSNINQMIAAIKRKQPLLLTQAVTFMKGMFDSDKIFPNFDDLTRKLFQEIDKMENGTKKSELLSITANIIASREIMWARKKEFDRLARKEELDDVSKRKQELDDVSKRKKALDNVTKVIKAHLGRAIYYLERVSSIKSDDTARHLAIAYNLLQPYASTLNYHDDSSVMYDALKLEAAIDAFTKQANGDVAKANAAISSHVQKVLREKVAAYPCNTQALPAIARPALPPVDKIRADMNTFVTTRLGALIRSRNFVKTTLHLLAETCTDVKLFKELQEAERAYIKALEEQRRSEMAQHGHSNVVVPRSAFTRVDSNGLLPGDVAINAEVATFLNSICIPKENYEAGIRYWFEGVSGKIGKEAAETGAGVGIIQFQYQHALDARREIAVIPNHMKSLTTVGEDEIFLLAGHDAPVVVRTFGGTVEYNYTSNANGAENLAKIFYNLLAKALKVSVEFDWHSVEEIIKEAEAHAAVVDKTALTQEVVLTVARSGSAPASANVKALVEPLFQQAKKIAAGCIEKIIVTDDTHDGRVILYCVVNPEHRQNPKVAEALYKMLYDLGIAPTQETECPAAAILTQTVKDRQKEALTALLRAPRYKAIIESNTFCDKNGHSLLMQALPAYGSGASQEMACALIEAGANVLVRENNRTDSILSHVVRYQFEQVAPVLIAKLRTLLPTAELNATLTYQMREALFNSGSQIMKLLLDAGANANTVIDFGWEWGAAPILHWASFCYGQHYNEKIALLLEKGARISAVLPPRSPGEWFWGQWGIRPGDDALVVALERLADYTSHSSQDVQQNVVFVDRIKHLLAAGPVGRGFNNVRAEQVVARLSNQEITALFTNVRRGIPIVPSALLTQASLDLKAKSDMDTMLARMDRLDRANYSRDRQKRGRAAYGAPDKRLLDYYEDMQAQKDFDIFIGPGAKEFWDVPGRGRVEHTLTGNEITFYMLMRELEDFSKILAGVPDNTHATASNPVIRKYAASLQGLNVRELAIRITQLSSALGQLNGWQHVEEFMEDQATYRRKRGPGGGPGSGVRTRGISGPQPAAATMAFATAATACAGNYASLSAAPVAAAVSGTVVAEETWHAGINYLDINAKTLGAVKLLREHQYGKETYYILSYVMNLALDCCRQTPAIPFSLTELALCVIIQLSSQKLTMREKNTNLSFEARGSTILKKAEEVVNHLINMNPAAFAKFRDEQSRGVQWPHSPQVRRLIERAGFVFRPMMIKRDRCVCDACGVEVSGWRSYYDPWLLHDWSKRHAFAPPPGTFSKSEEERRNAQAEEQRQANAQAEAVRAEAARVAEAARIAAAQAAAAKAATEAAEVRAALEAVARYEAKIAAENKAAADAVRSLSAYAQDVDMELMPADSPPSGTHGGVMMASNNGVITPMAAMAMSRPTAAAVATAAAAAAGTPARNGVVQNHFRHSMTD